MSIKSFIKSLDFRLSDIFLAIWITTGLIIFLRSCAVVEGDFATLGMPIGGFIVLFSVFSLSFLVYCYLENKRHHLNYILLSALLLVIVYNILNTSLRPLEYTLDGINFWGDPITRYIVINAEDKVIHSFAVCFVLCFYFSSLFILPKRIKNLNLISLLGFLVYFGLTLSIVYSFFVDDYIAYFNCLFNNSNPEIKIKDFVPTSFYPNPNFFASYLVIGIVYSLLLHSLSHKKYHFIFSGVFGFYLLLSLNKSLILLTVISVLTYLVYKLVIAIQNKDKRTTIVLSSIFSFIVTACITLITLSFTIESLANVRGMLFSYSDTLSGRLNIWKCAIAFLKDGKFINGFGFGIYNTILKSFSTFSLSHNWFFTILGRGGILMVLLFISAIAYLVYKLLILRKHNIEVMIILLIGLSISFIHSCLEDNYYIIFLYSIVIASLSELKNEIKNI